MHRRTSRLLALCAATAVLAFASPAWANSTISINPGNVPTLAADYQQECNPRFGGGPYANYDVWVFNLPSKDAGDFVWVKATFSTPATVTKTIPTDGGGIDLANGTSKAWIITPAGWKLTGATAEITGTAEQFVLTHTCKADGSESPSPNPSTPGPGTPTPSTLTPGMSGASGNPSTSPAGGLPVTGTAVTGLVIVAAIFVAGGAGLMLVQRRRKLDDAI